MVTNQTPKERAQGLLSLLITLRAAMYMRQRDRPVWFSMYVGLCRNLRRLSAEKGAERPNLEPYFIDWPSFSGNKEFPITYHNNGTESTEYFSRIAQYDRRSPYCRLRYDLIDYLIERVKAECALDSLT